MKKYLSAERLKNKRSFTKKLIIIAPIVTLLITATSPRYYQMNSFNWWYIMLLPSFIALMSCLANRHEDKHKYRAVFSLPINTKSVWLAKVLVLCEYVFLASLVLLIGFSLGYLWLNTANSIPFINALTAVLVIIFTVAWQIPLCLFLAKKIGLLLTVMLNSGFGLITSIITVGTSYWWLNPYSITARLMCPITKILPNGTMAEANSRLLNSNVILPGLVLSAVLFIALSWLTSKWFSKREAL